MAIPNDFRGFGVLPGIYYVWLYLSGAPIRLTDSWIINIVRNTKEESRPDADYTKMSCAKLALVDEQGISINHSIASAAASLLAKMLVTKDLRYHCAYVSLNAGTQFVNNSPRILRKHLKAAKGTVSPLDYEGEEEE